VLFVYAEKTDPNYLYTIPLESLNAVKEDCNNPHSRSVTVSPGFGTGKDRQDENIVNVLLLDARKKLVYQIAFNVATDKDIADEFVRVVQSINKTQKGKGKIPK
jgi:Nitrogen regulatory protein P-II.